MRAIFVCIALALFVASVTATLLSSPYHYRGEGVVPNNMVGLLSAGLAIAGGLALIASALDRPQRPEE